MPWRKGVGVLCPISSGQLPLINILRSNLSKDAVPPDPRGGLLIGQLALPLSMSSSTWLSRQFHSLGLSNSLVFFKPFNSPKNRPSILLTLISAMESEILKGSSVTNPACCPTNIACTKWNKYFHMKCFSPLMCYSVKPGCEELCGTFLKYWFKQAF